MAKEEFVKMMTTDLPDVPQYFSRDAEINRTGAEALGDLPRPAALTPEGANVLAEQGYTILDVRMAASFGNGHVPGAINIGLSGQFASWAGTLIPIGTPIVIVADELGQVDEAVTRLARVGLESVKGYLGGGMFDWGKAGFDTATIAQIPVDELHARLKEKNGLQLIDVRRPGEYNSGHAPGAENVQLTDLERLSSQFDSSRPAAIICASGFRSSIATSILERRGFKELFNVVGGTSAWASAGYSLEQQTSTSAN
jgi:rhodanese-related sulfurtransferase